MTPAEPILVTGASGFIGSHLVRRLAETGADVHVFLRSSSDTRRLGDLPGRLERHDADLTDPASLRTAVRRVRPRTVFHCASWGGHPGQTDGTTIFGTNLAGTFHLLAACEEAGFDRFVHTGSSSEYGMKTAPMSEEDEPAPVDAYGASKAGATLWCRAAAISRGLPVVTLRLFSPYGPWDDPVRLIPAAARAFLEGRSLQLASPSGARDFVHVDDVVDACLLAATVPSAAGEIINVGSGRQATAGEVVGILSRLIPSAPPPSWGVISPRAGSSVWVADIGKARRILGWEPKVPLEEGLRQTVEWIRNETF
jgi:nucleoside-diphosphate-sugar epimerase